MSEFSQLLGRIFQKKEDKSDLPTIQSPKIRVFNPVAEPDLARLFAIQLTPGVLNGTLPYQTKNGVEVIDFDNRDQFMRPTKKFYPGADIADFEVK